MVVIQDERLKHLSSLSTFAARIRFCNSQIWEKLGSGTGRTVYAYSDTLVVKLAKNAKGVAQNNVESDVCLHQWYGSTVTDVIDADSDDKWLVAERVRKAVAADFKIHFGYPMKDVFGYITRHFDVRERQAFEYEHLTASIIQALDENEQLQDLTNLICNWQMEDIYGVYNDLISKRSWGVGNNRLILMDYGFTKTVCDEHYK